MSETLIDVAFWILHGLGALLIIAALFLYPHEEESFQATVERWQAGLNVVTQASRSKVEAFMQQAASVTERGFERLFGPRLFSLRVIPISIYLSFSSLFLLFVLIWPWMKYSGPKTRHEALLMFVSFLYLALVPALFKNRWLLAIWSAIIPVVLLSLTGFIVFVFRTRGSHFGLRLIGYTTLVFGYSLICDLSCIALTRFTLRRVKQIDRISTILLVLVGNLLASTIPLVTPIYLGVEISRIAPQMGAAIFASVLFNSIDVLVGSAAFLVAALLLVHRLFWPMIQRPLFAIYRFSPLKQKRWLFTVGLALLFLPKHLTVAAFKALVERF